MKTLLIDLQGQERPEDNSNYEALPAGRYPVRIESIDEKTTSAGDKALNFQFTITGDKYNNRRLFSMLNLWNSKSEQAREIALRELYDIHEAAGFKEIQEDAQMLVGAPMEIDVTVKDHWDTEKAEAGEKVNRIKKYGKVNGGDSKQSSANPKPWEQKK